MAKEWYATCKDCGKEYGYSDASYVLGVERGMSRPERCPACRKLHMREISTVGLSHFELKPITPLPAAGIQPGRLGGLIRPPRVHEEKVSAPTFDHGNFGVKDQHIREFFDLMQQHQVTVIVAPTGAGKSTFLPFRLMAPPDPYPADLWTRNGQIVITQPRIQATRNIPAFVARDLHGSSLGAGYDVGFRHSGSPATDWRNKLVFMTDGTLINMIVRNELNKLSVIMIDEAHERSLNIDLILGLLKQQLPRYPHLKLIIASATINTDLFINYYGQNVVGFYEFPGKRQYPVEARFRESDPIPNTQMPGRMPDEVASKVLEILLSMETDANPELITMEVNGKPLPVKGDILAFLHGEKPIERACSQLREMVDDEPKLAGKVDVLPLYTKLSQAQQDLALKPKKNKDRWRVVVSTNVAETSLTVEGVVHVVETALINESQWDPQTQTTFIVPKVHSQAGCKQRWGRAGRVRPGIAHCLYTVGQFEQFPKHTHPEIVRAPLEQIVLTAKAAGVDDIQVFDWIERPPEAELQRAPHYLRQIGALDHDGDLTEHGLELRNFTAETDIANLMILADRLGCVVEMATLLPMMNLGGYTKILQWDRSWDAPTKRSIHRVHLGLIQPCLDDVEFYLKLWDAWEGQARTGADRKGRRKQWADSHFVNHTVLKKTVLPERDALLASLSGHKKESTLRPIDFGLLTRVRFAMTYGLPHQIYRLESAASETAPSTQPVYRPYIHDPAANPELVALHQDAVVEISPESICFQRQLPAHFVCGKRQRVNRRLSPQTDPITIIAASFITLIDPDWLDIIEQSPIMLARRIAAETRNDDGTLKEVTTRARLFIDQNYPIGTRFECQFVNGIDVDLIRQLKQRPRFSMYRSYDEIESPEEIEILDAEGQLDPSAGVTDIGEISEEPEIDNTGIWSEILESDDQYDQNTTATASLKTAGNEQFYGKIVFRYAEPADNALFAADVVGYDFSDRRRPAIELIPPIIPDPFDTFAERYKVGDDITVEYVTVEQYVNDWLAYLVVREVETGMEIVLDPYDASFLGRNFAIRYFDQFEPGLKFQATIEELKRSDRHVRVHRLKFAETSSLRFMGKLAERVIDATIVEVRDNGLYLQFDSDQTQDHIPVGAFVHINRLPQRPDEMSIDQHCRVKVQPRQWRKPLRRSLTNLDEELLDRLAKYPWDGKLRWSEADYTLTLERRMSYIDRTKLHALSDDPVWRRSVTILFRRSNEYDCRILDVTGVNHLLPYQERNVHVPGEIITVTDGEVFVKVDGGLEARIPKREASFDPAVNLREVLQAGGQVDILIKALDVDEGRADLSLLDPAFDPLNRYSVDQLVTGKIVHIIDSGAFIELEVGVQGYVHVSNLAWQRIEQPAECVSVEQHVEAQVVKIDRDERRLELTMRLPSNDPLRKFQVDQRIEGTVVNFTNDGSATFVELAPGADGYLHRDDIRFDRPETARDALQVGERIAVRITDLDHDERRVRLTAYGLYVDTIYVPSSHAGLVIGKGGSVIKGLQESHQTRINLEKDGFCIVQGPTEAQVHSTVAEIRKILLARIIKFKLKTQRQIPMLLGRRGQTIQGIENGLSVKIDLDNATREVTVTAPDEMSASQVLTRIRDAISYSEATIRIPTDRIRYVIGTKGSIINSIKDSTGARIDISRDGTGHVKIFADSRSQVDRAIEAIRSHAYSADVLTRDDAGLPIYTEYRGDSPPPALPTSTSASPVQHQTRVETTSKPLPNSPKAAAQPKVAPAQPQQTITIARNQIIALAQKQGGFFSRLFGGGQSLLVEIQSATRTKITINSSTGEVHIIGSSDRDVAAAVDRIRKSLR